jgi:hypothetical protein
MNEHLVKMAVAFALGTGATAGILRLLWFLPVPGYIKQALGIVVPLPVMLVALVMLYYGPGALSGQEAVMPSSMVDLRKMFLYGIITALGYLVVATVIRMVLRKTSDGDEE